MNAILLSLALACGWADSMRLSSHQATPAPAVGSVIAESPPGPRIELGMDPVTVRLNPVKRPAAALVEACPGCVCGCTEGKPCVCSKPATIRKVSQAERVVTPPTDNRKWHRVFVAGQWQDCLGVLKANGMVAYEHSDNPQLILTPPQTYFTTQPAAQPYQPAAAYYTTGTSSCSGGSCRRR